ncbi:ribonuclease III [Dapis sp. BLCC M229]|uniref:ribonuclease III n=1 Tax=Dapis sp. BLCC M229 TaxID=3400188 RepID=UPI003CEDD54B
MTQIYHPRQKQLKSLVEKLSIPHYSKIKWNLLDLALIHSTVSSTHNYEKLEFVGDAVVRLVAAELLLENYPHCPVGEFAAIRSILVSDRSLAQIANKYGWGRYLLVSKSAAGDKAGEESRLADSFEAVLAALYLSTNNLELIRPWLDYHFEKLIAEIRSDPARQNYKAALQEWTQGHYKTLPNYQVHEANKIHGDRGRFLAEVWFKDKKLGVGKGPSIKAAEQAAAKSALDFLQQSGTENIKEEKRMKKD